MKGVGSRPKAPRKITASEFRAKCLKLMDEVAESGEEVVITKRADRDKLKILGDIISPIDVEWEAESDPDRVLNP